MSVLGDACTRRGVPAREYASGVSGLGALVNGSEVPGCKIKTEYGGNAGSGGYQLCRLEGSDQVEVDILA